MIRSGLALMALAMAAAPGFPESVARLAGWKEKDSLEARKIDSLLVSAKAKKVDTRWLVLKIQEGLAKGKSGPAIAEAVEQRYRRLEVIMRNPEQSANPGPALFALEKVEPEPTPKNAAIPITRQPTSDPAGMEKQHDENLGSAHKPDEPTEPIGEARPEKPESPAQKREIDAERADQEAEKREMSLEKREEKKRHLESKSEASGKKDAD